MTLTLEETKIKADALQGAIVDAVPRLNEQLDAIKTRQVQVDGQTGFIQTGHIDSSTVRSIVFDICVESAQPLPESVQLYMPGRGRPYMSAEALKTLINHLSEIARKL